MSRQDISRGVRRIVLVWTALAGATLGATPATVTPPRDNARAIVAEAQSRTTFKSERYEGTLRTEDAGGKVTVKRWFYERIGSHGTSRSVIRFTEPAEVRGVTLLVVNHPDRASDQWMWTPAIERHRRIAVQDRSTRFFGTDFSFEDLDERDVDHYDYTQLADDTIDGVTCWVIQSTPRDAKKSQYTKAVFWIRQDHHVYARADLWIDNAVVRRQTYSDLREIQGAWTAHDLTMTDLRRGSRTQLLLDKVQYDVPLHEDDFTLEGIRR